MTRKPRIAVWKFASCDGCQLSLLDLEDHLLALAGAVDIAYFLEASRNTQPGPYDISLVEGSITTPHDRRRILQIRKQSRYLVTIGACATAGGIQALRNFRNVQEFARHVYAHPEYLDLLEHSHPVADFVSVDFELRGCPVNKTQLLELLTALLAGRHPRIPRHSLCVECKRKGIPCVMVTQNQPCLGPITQAGCGALCPSFQRACFGCFGPAEEAQPSALSQEFRDRGHSPQEIVRLLRTFNAWAPAFREESLRHEHQE